MRKLLFILACFTALLASAQTEPADTVIVMRNASNVIVIENNDGIKVNVGDDGKGNSFTYNSRNASVDSLGNDWNLELPFLKKSRKRFVPVCFDDVFVGWTLPFDSDPSFKHSFEIGIPVVLGGRWRPASWTSLTVGVGFGFRRINGGHGSHLEKVDGRLKFLPNPDGVKDVKSNLQMGNIMVPIRWGIEATNWLDLELGVEGNFNIMTKAQSSYTLDSVKYHENYKDLQQRIFTVNLYGAIVFDKSIGVYVRYSPAKQMRSGFGPELRLMSVGFTLNF